MKRRQFLGASGLGFAATVVAPNVAGAQAPVANTMAWGSMTRTARDAAYNNAAAVDGSTQIVDGWVAASAKFRTQRAKHVDLAYGPEETALVAAARAAGCDVVDGREALVRQGAASFRIWTGIDAPVEVMRAAVRGARAAL